LGIGKQRTVPLFFREPSPVFLSGKKVTLIRKEGTILIPCGIPYIFGTVGGPENNVIPDGLLEKMELN